MRVAICAAVVRYNKILLVQKKTSWILPGGKPEPGEGPLECLYREIDEELPGTKIIEPRYYNNFIGKTPHTGDQLEARVYLAKIDGEPGKPTREIRSREWVRLPTDYSLSDLTNKILNGLVADKYL